CDWICIDAIASDATDQRWEDINLGWEQEVVHLGAGLQYRGVDRGFEVAGIEPGSIAQSMGLKQGDQLLVLADRKVVTNTDVAEVMSWQLPGEVLSAEVLRNGERLLLQCVLPEIPFIYSRDLPTAAIRAQASGNTISIETQRVARLRIFVSNSQFDLSQPIRVTLNGEEHFNAVVSQDVRFMLEQWTRDRDHSLVYEGFIELVVGS
ncbi:hypothetical protein KKG90_09450, partial [Candidatus Bipolaricaulota bacterium]|nr:hypothetical protein [Candidatus Bipolaricaulota bacterium]